jgi:predicted hydrocarbon binding protein
MTGYFYPQRMGRIILLAMEEVIGPDAVHSVLSLASLKAYAGHFPPARNDRTFPFGDVSALMQSLEQLYGPQGGRGTALRIGRACFNYGLREYGSLLGITEMAFRLLPLRTKLQLGAKSFAELFNKQTDQRVRVEVGEPEILWHIERCPLCWERKASVPACTLAGGLLQESLYWVSGGKIFNVEETACIAMGDPACSFRIQPAPAA